jgi:hypothetical protein
MLCKIPTRLPKVALKYYFLILKRSEIRADAVHLALKLNVPLVNGRRHMCMVVIPVTVPLVTIESIDDVSEVSPDLLLVPLL